METTFYDDSQMFFSGKEDMKSLKRSMKLDFNSLRQPKKQRYNSVLLSSPDLNMLKLASPELEKLIIQQNGFVTTTPTPTQILFPRTVTEEQESYARGFVDALAELHTYPGPTNPMAIAVSSNSSSLSNTTETTTVISNALLQPLANSTRTLTTLTTSTGPYVPPVPTSNAVTFVLPTIKEEPQTVPSLTTATPPLSPIDMASQERIKLERKRQRNRLAATKCRKRKLERISRLEDRVSILKDENSELSSVVNKLREQICQLKQQVLEHAKQGCQIMISQF